MFRPLLIRKFSLWLFNCKIYVCLQFFYEQKIVEVCTEKENIPKLFSTDSPENYSEPLDDTSWKPWDIQDDHQCKLGSVWEQP